MQSNFIRPIAFLFAAVLAIGACQDHHWKSYDKVGPLEVQKPSVQGDIVSGTLELGDTVKGKDFNDWWVFVIVRSKEGASMLAATRELVTGFPIQYSVTTKNIMVGKVNPGEKYIVEAILDKDGVAETKEGDPVVGRYGQPIEAGHTGALLTLNVEKGSPHAGAAK